MQLIPIEEITTSYKPKNIIVESRITENTKELITNTNYILAFNKSEPWTTERQLIPKIKRLRKRIENDPSNWDYKMPRAAGLSEHMDSLYYYDGGDVESHLYFESLGNTQARFSCRMLTRYVVFDCLDEHEVLHTWAAKTDVSFASMSDKEIAQLLIHNIDTVVCNYIAAFPLIIAYQKGTYIKLYDNDFIRLGLHLASGQQDVLPGIEHLQELYKDMVYSDFLKEVQAIIGSELYKALTPCTSELANKLGLNRELYQRELVSGGTVCLRAGEEDSYTVHPEIGWYAISHNDKVFLPVNNWNASEYRTEFVDLNTMEIVSDKELYKALYAYVDLIRCI